MIVRAKRGARRVARHYRETLAGFSHNARRLLFAHALGNVAMGVLITVFGIYVKTAGMSESVLGGSEGAISVAAAVTCLLAAPLISVYGYRRLLVTASVMFAVARFGQAALPATAPLLAFSLVDGVGEGIVQSAVTPFISENSTRAQRSHLFSVDLAVRVLSAAAGGLLGGVLPLAFGLLMPELAALRTTVASAGLLLALTALPFLRVTESLARPAHAFRDYMAMVRGFTSWGHSVRVMTPQLIVSTGAGFIMPFISLYLKEHLGASIAQVGIIQGVSQLAIAFGALLSPLIIRRFGLVKGMVLLEAASLPFLVAIPFANWLPLAAVLFWVRAALMNMSWPLFNEYSMAGVPPAEKPLVAGLFAFAWSIGWLTGSVAGGRVMADVSYTFPYFVTAALYALGILATAMLFREPPHEGAAEPVTLPARVE